MYIHREPKKFKKSSSSKKLVKLSVPNCESLHDPFLSVHKKVIFKEKKTFMHIIIMCGFFVKKVDSITV